MAAVDRSADLRDASFDGLHKSVESQFYPGLYGHTGGSLVEARLDRTAEIVWDSRRGFSSPGSPGTGLFAGLPVCLWDSTWLKNLKQVEHLEKFWDGTSKRETKT